MDKVVTPILIKQPSLMELTQAERMGMIDRIVENKGIQVPLVIMFIILIIEVVVWPTKIVLRTMHLLTS